MMVMKAMMDKVMGQNRKFRVDAWGAISKSRKNSPLSETVGGGLLPGFGVSQKPETKKAQIKF